MSTVFTLPDGGTLTYAPPPVTLPAPPVAPVADLPVAVAARLGTIIDDDQFQTAEKWGTLFSDTWFGGEKFNAQQLDPTLITFSAAGVTLGVNGTTGCLMSTNPGGGATPGLQVGYCYWQVRALLQPGGWNTCWMDGQSWPNDGEIDLIEQNATSNYHSGGPSQSGTDAPQNHTLARNYADGNYHNFGVMRTADAGGTNYIYVDGAPALDNHGAPVVYPTYDKGSPMYLILSVGSSSGGGGMTVARSTVWNIT